MLRRLGPAVRLLHSHQPLEKSRGRRSETLEIIRNALKRLVPTHAVEAAEELGAVDAAPTAREPCQLLLLLSQSTHSISHETQVAYCLSGPSRPGEDPLVRGDYGRQA